MDLGHDLGENWTIFVLVRKLPGRMYEQVIKPMIYGMQSSSIGSPKVGCNNDKCPFELERPTIIQREQGMGLLKLE